MGYPLMKELARTFKPSETLSTKTAIPVLLVVPVILCIVLNLPAFAQQQAQTLRLRSGALGPERNLMGAKLNRTELQPMLYNRHVYVLLRFDRLPDRDARAALDVGGIRLFDYLSGNAYLAELPDSFSIGDLRRFDVLGLYRLPEEMKIAPKLQGNADAFSHDPERLIAVAWFGTMGRAEVVAGLQKAGARVITPKLQPDRVVFIQAGEAALERIAALPFVSYITVQHIKPGSLNQEERASHGIDALNSPTGRNLRGDNVTIGVGDNADPYTHVDFTGRLIDRYPDTPDVHGTHTTGTAAGGGILDPRYAGLAPHATIVSQFFTDILVNTPTYITDYNMVATNNSYDDADVLCPGEGEYDFLSNYVDQQLTANPHLIHVFAAGNDGFATCNGYPLSFGTVKSGFQSAKNVICVGNFHNFAGSINPGSSRGPVNDGRLKPDVVAGGSSLYSTEPYNTYGLLSGTSQAAPGVTGSLALLYQRYRQLHGGADPTAVLAKALICNSATDVGNPGPDYTYGFGTINARAAVEAMENVQYFTGTMNANGTASYVIPGVAAGATQIKIMLYWMDPAAAPLSSTALVNDLDLTVIAPDASLHHPMILNPSPAHVNDPAVEGVDHMNNIEQVVINNPPAGGFTVNVSGAGIATGSQDFVITWQVVQPSIVVESPYGDETIVPGTLGRYIRWTAFGGDPNTFTIEYSTDNGGTWTTIDNAVPSASRSYLWYPVPATPTNRGLVRITRNGTGISGTSHSNFTLLGQPIATVGNPCQGYAQVNWGSIPSATSYDIYQLKGDSMQIIANTTDTSYLLGGLSRDSSYWLAVSGVIGGSPGIRSLAVNVQPSGGACGLSATNNDLTVDSLFGPSSGRMFTSSQLTNATPIRVEAKNLGATGAGSYTLSYRINGGSIVTETPPALAGNTSSSYTFTQTADLSAPGTYTLQTWVSNPGDPTPSNDTLTATIKQLLNDPLTLSPSFIEGFESAASQTYTTAITGIAGDDRCDFSSSNANGRARPFINTGFARTGNRCLTLDQSHYSKTGSTADSLVTTYNLSEYTSSDQIWLDFYYQNQGIDFILPGNQVWIRGNDQAAWIPVYALNTSAAAFGAYQPSAHIDVTGVLKGATPAQSVSSSFQVKFGEEGYTSTNSVIPDGNLDDGYSFDDITLTRAVNDIGALSLVSPSLSTLCGLSNAESVSISVKNYSSATATNIPVSYSINGSTVTENIPSIAPFDSVVYTFTQKADLSAFKGYTLTGWVGLPGDSYRKNDTLVPLSFQTTPLISAYPYLQDFETGPGSWYTAGVNDDWQWGVPAKTIINRAASGTHAWVTNLTGDYNSNELSYLYSPCFDLSSLDTPMLSFSHIFRTEDACDCDYHWVEYSTDGVNWLKLGATGLGTNWYDNTARQAWQRSDTIWHVSSYAIPTRGTKVRFRIVMFSDPATTYEGVGIDDIHVFEKASVYGNANTTLTQSVSDTNWVNFDLGGRRIVSINPRGQDLGQTKVSVFINGGSVRNDGSQYYLDRNIVIQPANVPQDSVGVRFYFLDSEADKLLAATGCTSCLKFHDAYRAGVMQYSTPTPAEEDSSLLNDANGTFNFINASSPRLAIVPYDNGYYAEYFVHGFSEFWLNSGTPGPGIPLPLALLGFTATKSGSSGLLKWSTTGEGSTNRYVIEKGHDASVFSPIDSVNATGDSNTVSHYQYTDAHLWNGINYYRLRMVADNGHILYSPLRSITDTIAGAAPGVFPNPVVGGMIYVSTLINCQSIRLMDALGRTIRVEQVHGLLNTLFMPGLAAGVYFVEVRTDDGNSVYKIFVK